MANGLGPVKMLAYDRNWRRYYRGCTIGVGVVITVVGVPLSEFFKMLALVA